MPPAHVTSKQTGEASSRFWYFPNNPLFPSFGPYISPQTGRPRHALLTHCCMLVYSHPKLVRILPIPFPTPPTLKVHSQGHPRVLIDDVGDADSRNDLQQVGGNSSIKSCHALPGHNVVNQGQHGGFWRSFL